ncbi:MAG: phosphatidylserine decarboxylase [Firmicutes bacterium]|nr:phosphatidylserine decarboxylase [Candidatus Colivicinus equi]
MNKKIVGIIIALVVMLLVGTYLMPTRSVDTAPPYSGISSDVSLKDEHMPKTMELISMFEHNPELKHMMEESIAKAQIVNPDPSYNPVITLEDYYIYLDIACQIMPWMITPRASDIYPTLYDRIDESLNYFYFLNDQPLEELEGLGYYNNSIQYHEPYRSWMISFIEDYGKFLNTTESWNDIYYETCRESGIFDLDSDTYEDKSNWHTFNQFFARYLSSLDKRPISSPDDNSVVVSPADSKPQGVWRIDENSKLLSNEKVTVKSGIFSQIDVLLGDSAYKDNFAEGSFTHTFLDVNDYHRFHFPVGGEIVDVGIIGQDDALGGRVVWDDDINRYLLECSEPGWQMIETRGYVVVDTKDYGYVAIIPVGMSQISSVCFEENVKVGNTVKKGDMMGCFLFGGSDIIMLFEKEANFELTSSVDEKGNYNHILVGETYGKVSK